MAIKLVWRTDVHMADDGPASRTDVWSDTVLGKLRQVGRIARDVGAVAVLDGGDFFHVKSPTRNSHDLVRRVAELHRDYPCRVWANVGNHDCKYGDLAYLPEQPLGVLFATGVFNRLYDGHEVYFGPTSVSVPMISAFAYNAERKFGGKVDPFFQRAENGSREPIVRVVGVPYHGTTYDMSRLVSIKKGREDFLVVAAHMLASPGGGQMFEAEDIVKYADLVGLDPDLWLFGHWHKDQGVQEIAPGKHVVNIGSLTRGSISQDEQARRPACAVLSFDRSGITIDVRRLDVAPADTVFDLTAKVIEESRDLVMEEFADQIRQNLVLGGGRTLQDDLRDMPDLPALVRERASVYLEEAATP